MSETQLNTVVLKPTTIEILAQVRAKLTQRKEDSASGKAVGTGGEPLTGRSRILKAASAVVVRAKLLQTELTNLEKNEPINYRESMRRLVKFQSMAGVLNICLLSGRGFPSAEIVSRNPYSKLSTFNPDGDEMRLINARKNILLQAKQEEMTSYEYTLLAKLNSGFAALTRERLGADIEQKISAISVEITSLTENMLSSESLAQSTFAKIGRESKVEQSRIDKEFARFSSGDSSGYLHEIHMEANPYYCAQVDPQKQEEAKKQLTSILGKSWTLLDQIETLGIGHSGIPGVMSKVKELRISVLNILASSDNLLLREVQEINSMKN